MALLAECPKCGATVKYKANSVDWAKKHSRCKHCASINCMNFNTEYPYGVKNWDVLMVETWESAWKIGAFKWSWLKFKWVKAQ